MYQDPYKENEMLILEIPCSGRKCPKLRAGILVIYLAGCSTHIHCFNREINSQ